MSSCEMDLSLEELDVIIHKSPLNKSPGPDGLPFEFYRTFWQDIKEFVLEVFKDCTERWIDWVHEAGANYFNSKT